MTSTSKIHEKVAVIGMGKTGLSVVRHLQRLHIACACFDEAKVSLPEDMRDIPLSEGALQVEQLQDFDRIIVSPGMDWRHTVLVALREQGKAVYGDLDEFLSHYSGQLLAVTGTNGKTTVTEMMALLLETLDKGCEAGGNIGVPMLDLLANDMPARVVLELSSFQLERSKNLHPSWAVLLNIQPDHADMHDSEQAYRAAKVRMFEHMKIHDVALLPIDLDWDMLSSELAFKGVLVARFGILSTADSRSNMMQAGILLATANEQSNTLFWTQEGERQSIACDKLMLKGTHQQQNIAVAAQAAADYGVSAAVIEEAMMSFQGLEHRLEYIGTFAERACYNDSKATNPDASLAALTSFQQATWICGGLRKGLALDGLLDAVKQHVDFACVIGKQPQAYIALLEQAGVPFVVSKNVEQAVQDAFEFGKADILLSPAAASQDQFKNYAERGKSFVQAIQNHG
ncbi:MAG: UDP-N-acetylmuramoyl-L-alanine--D-glutamate ligase [Mariprofundaceae bacterium]|nr:UDP-N-acetylmuramoyl-L-alanine--D-glutamate ligase [Mariprofundaceae bacterium]